MPPVFQIVIQCGNNDLSQETECRAEGIVQDLKLKTQLSESECLFGVTFQHFRQYVLVRSGCSGIFTYEISGK